MKTKYRIVEKRHDYNGSIRSVFYPQHKGWWPFWTNVGAWGYPNTGGTLEEVQSDIRRWRAEAAVTRKDIIHPIA